MRGIRSTALGATMLLGAACGGAGESGGSGSSEQPAEPQESTLEVVAQDFEFALSQDSVPAGTVEVTFVNEGKEPHEGLFYRLDEGVTFDEFVEAANAEDASTELPPDALDLVTPAGGVSSTISSGDDITTNARLEPGLHAMVCHILDTNGEPRPHFQMGMIAPLEVTG